MPTDPKGAGSTKEPDAASAQAENVQETDLSEETEETATDEARTLVAQHEEEEALVAQNAADEEDDAFSYTPKLSKKMQKNLQIAGGWLFGFLVWFSLALGAMFPENSLIGWLFLLVFVIALAIRNQIELRTGVSMRLFMKWFLISLAVFLVVFLFLGPIGHVLPGS